MICPKVYRIPKTNNWGDIFTPFLLKKGFGVEVNVLEIGEAPEDADDPVIWRREKDLANREEAEIFSCGSLLERIPDVFTGHVLGCGAGYAGTRRNLMSVKAPLLLRGRLTAERCTYQQTARFGDPGMLAWMFAVPTSKRYKHGIVPHYLDKGNLEIEQWVRYKKAVCIDIESGITNVINAIASCETIVSSSLHGLVIADSLSIPSKFIKFSDVVFGDGFKIHDYYSAYGESEKYAVTLEEAFSLCRDRDVTCVKKAVFDVFTEYAEGLK